MPLKKRAKKVAVEVRKDTHTKAVTFRVSHVHDGGTWQDLWRCLHQCWQDTTCAANLAIQYYVQNDRPLEKTPKLYAYPAIREQVPGLATHVASTIANDTLKDYKRHRGAFWRGERSPPLYRYPAPYPIRKQQMAGALSLVHDQRPALTLTFGTKEAGGTRRFTLVLAGGQEFARQRQDFLRMMEGVAQVRSAQVYRQSCGAVAATRNVGTAQEPGGRNKSRHHVMVKVIADFPVRERAPSAGALVLTTDPEALWVACHEGREVRPWVLNGDEAARWLARHRDWHADHSARLQRMRQDLKVERRTRVGGGHHLQGAMDAMCEKHRRRMKTFLGQCAAGIVNYCVRQGISDLLYSDENRLWCPQFPWHQLRMELKYRCEREGITPGGVLLCDDEPEEEIDETPTEGE